VFENGCVARVGQDSASLDLMRGLQKFKPDRLKTVLPKYIFYFFEERRITMRGPILDG
jgi:hypothetical protein